jgi:hypothetical protein
MARVATHFLAAASDEMRDSARFGIVSAFLSAQMQND